MSARRRLTEIDALRGIAAMLVVLFHYTTRYDELFGHSSAPLAALPWGYLGVNLFFMISGFVIFMTLENTRKPMDFVASRFSRLYPAYWAAVALTYGVVHLLGLPGKEVTPLAALINLSMLQGFFGVAPVDGVYWTLGVELIFYGWALLAFRLGWLARLPLLLAALLALRLLYWGVAHWLHRDLPWVLYQFLILHDIPWFGAGVLVYRLATGTATAPRADLAGIVAAAATLAIVDGWPLALLLLALAALLYGAARCKLAWLRLGVLGWLGTISYTLYLVHENMGWALIRRLEHAGVPANGAIAVALACSLALASALTVTVERPAMRWLRAAYSRRQPARGVVGIGQ